MSTIRTTAVYHLRSTIRTTVCRCPPAGPQAGTPHVALVRRALRRLRRGTRRERSVHRLSLTSQIHCSPSSDGSMGISQAPRGPSGLRVAATGPSGPARRDTQGRSAPYCSPTPRPRVTHSGPCHPQAASPRALRARQTSTAVTCVTVRDIPYSALRFSAPLLFSAWPACQTDLARTAAAG